MKFLLQIAAFAFFLIGAAALQAQPGGGGRAMNPEQRAEQQTVQMKEKLALSDAQAEKVKEINLKYANKAKEAREKADGDWEAMRGTMGALRDEQDKELQTVMTQEQWQKWAQFREEQRANRGGFGPGNRPDADKPAPAEDSGKKPKKAKKNKKSNSDSTNEQ